MEKRLDIGTYPARTMPFAWNAGIINTKEKWELVIRTLNGSDELLEEAILNITFPNGKTWEGTMQDLMAVFAVLERSKEVIEHSINAHDNSNNVPITVNRMETYKEIKYILSHLKPDSLCLEDQQKP